MAFNSFHFAVFFLAVFALYWTLRGNTPRMGLLLLASYYFYASWDWRYASLLLISTSLDFSIGLGLVRARRRRMRKGLLALSLAGNLGILATFKYFNFFLESFRTLVESVGLRTGSGYLEVLLPVGISFYTFQTLSYTIDIYRGTLRPTRNPLKFATYVAFFPQLVAGPIVRAADFLPQLDEASRYDDQRALNGLLNIFRGLIKKVAIADTLAMAIVDPVFGNPGAYSGLTNLIAVYAYALQIYCDFSGYSDVAIGAARMLGFELRVNFNRPYVAKSVKDFWSRWHISLSTWLRDYLYISLGGNRRGRPAMYRNLAATMLLGGLWHGAAWNFVLWGMFHGGWLIANRLRSEAGAREGSSGGRLVQWAATFHLVCLSWVLFRCTSLAAGWEMVRRILTGAPGESQLSSWLVWLPLIVGYGVHFVDMRKLAALQGRFTKLPSSVQAAAYGLALALLTAMSGSRVPFIYFQF